MSADQTRVVAARRSSTINKRRFARSIAAFVALLVVQSGCGITRGGPPPVPPEQRAAYGAAMGNLPASPAAAASALKAFIAQYPRSQLADDVTEQLSQIAFAEGRQEDGIRLLGEILSRYPRSDRAAPARLRLAQREYGRDRQEAARRLLDRLDFRRLALRDQRAALRLRIAMARTPVERLEQLSLLASKLDEEADQRADASGPQARLEARREAVGRDISRIILSAAPAELEAMVKGLRRRPPTSAILLELSRRALDSGQLELASRRIDRAESQVHGDLDRGQLRLLSDRLVLLLEAAEADAELPPLRELADRPRPRTDGASGTIGVVLPLSGRFASFGQESLRGILLAADLFAEDEEVSPAAGYPDEGFRSGRGGRFSEDARLRLIVRDSEGDPVKAAAAVRELAANSSVLAVVGPIFSAESLGAAEAAERANIPLVTLSTKLEVAAGRTQAFRIRTTPADEVGVLVSHAFETLKAKRFAVLYPDTRYGRGMRKLYWDAVMARGGKMVATSSYGPRGPPTSPTRFET